MQEAGLRERVGRRLGDVHRMGQGMLVNQMGIANKLSYMAIDDIVFPGVVSCSGPTIRLSHSCDLFSHARLGAGFPMQSCIDGVCL